MPEGERSTENWPYAPLQYKNGANKIMWLVAIGATALLTGIFLTFLSWVGITLWQLNQIIASQGERITALERAIMDLLQRMQ